MLGALNLLAEKFRSLLQQPIRKRNREQDVYDLNLLIAHSRPFSKDEQSRLLQLVIGSCKERGINANKVSFANPDVRKMAEQGYKNLAPEIDGPLPPFEDAYATVQNFYESLPWTETI